MQAVYPFVVDIISGTAPEIGQAGQSTTATMHETFNVSTELNERWLSAVPQGPHRPCPRGLFQGKRSSTARVLARDGEDDHRRFPPTPPRPSECLVTTASDHNLILRVRRERP